MSENKNIKLYCVAFEVGRDFVKTVVRSEMIAKSNTVSVPLWHQTTVGENIKFQLEAYDGENNLLVKSQLVEGVFLPSVSGVQSAGNYECNGMAESVAANTIARHTHENAYVLEKLADDNGTLKYNGNPIGGSTEIKVKSFPAFEASDIYDGDTNKDVVGLLYKTNETENPLPENSIVVDVGIVLTDGVEIKRSQMRGSNGFDFSVVELYNVPSYDEIYEAFLAFRVINLGTSIQNTPLYETILMGEGYSHINIYYI